MSSGGFKRRESGFPVTVGVVICAFTDKRWDEIAKGIRCLTEQTVPVDQVVMSIDHNPELAQRVRDELAPLINGLQVVEFDAAGGSNSCGARNAGIAALSSDIVCFLDDDAWPEPDWIEQLVKAFDDPRVEMAGSRILPEWPDGGAPRWFPPEFNWVVGGSWRGLPEVDAEIRNPIGAAMAVRKSALETVGGFDTNMGHRQGRPLGNDETDLALRISEAIPGARIVQRPASCVHHKVTPERMEFRYFTRRCWLEGRSKGQTTDRHGTSALGVELAYVVKYLSTGVLGSIVTLRIGRAVSIIVGFSLTTAGWATERLTRLVSRSSK